MSKSASQSHPKGLYTLFATEFWERFSYYGMRGFFVLYLTATLAKGGFGLEKTEAYSIYGIFTALVYVTPIIGGILADKLIGQRKSIYVGALLMAIGQFTMALSVTDMHDMFLTRQMSLYLGLGLLITGNGFFKPNISTMVGGLYSSNDPNKDNGFTIFYMGINLGAFVTNFVGGSLAENVGWQYGFMAAGIGMVISTIWFFLRETSVVSGETGLPVGLPPKDDPHKKNKLEGKDWTSILSYVVGLTVFSYIIVHFLINVDADIINTIVGIIGIGGFAYLSYTIYQNTEGATQWSRVGVILALAIFNIVFWSGFEQAGTSFNTFANEYTDRNVMGFEVPASWFQSINAVFIIILAPLFTVIWGKLSDMKLNPRTPYKFAWSLVFLAIGFGIMAIANDTYNASNALISPMWLVMVYFFHTVGELCMSPIGLSMITKLSPPKIVSVMMGLWMGSIALGNFFAAQMTAISEYYEFDTFYFITVYALVAAALAFVVSPFLTKMMKGIH
ncbi:peptide MFS transporter [Flammeovirga kamogawensis]|uniref:Peptide MFS transporter n=1 Tax=Flammeovirga kamogawensis TaxID=373891 RepID=A0ABX8GWS4_9BACT|nr:peptide MFS transporter [Flammeovirga kamogawensis]MBB6460695.1 POT family proton-dependent oligopeptide transporter [Flammeovirga kamogawensis]QWG08050.1 peptide MFS transporter [Flammeovirga kamogawensis]TRX69857.1 peptide MFS transporter [Flammeovirga kamogawensis]